MKTCTVQQMRELEQQAGRDYQISSLDLMEEAGFQIARFVDTFCKDDSEPNDFVVLIAGHGNNGGDALAAARHLKQWKYDVEVWLTGSAQDLRGDAQTQLQQAIKRKVKIMSSEEPGEWESGKLIHLARKGKVPFAVVDGILGTGLQGAARGLAAEAIKFVNVLARRSIILSIDIPSGLNADTGEVAGEAVRAHHTLALGLPKRGLLQPQALDYAGCLSGINIGIPGELIAGLESDLEYLVAGDFNGLIEPRQRTAHKGDFGHVLIIGGAAGYAGAVSLAAQAALRSGAGRVSVLTPRSVVPIVAATALEAMVHAAPETDAGSLAASALAGLSQDINQFSAILIGPGMTRHPDGRLLVGELLRNSRVPLILDADALNLFERRASELKQRRAPLVITPHPGEMGRLLGHTSQEIQAGRFQFVREASEQTNAVVVLKGAGTLVAAPGEVLQVNTSGNAGMATAGSGDVLAGMLASLAGQGLRPFDAARIAVFLHGTAGDMATEETSEAGLIASDILQFIPRALKLLTS